MNGKICLAMFCTFLFGAYFWLSWWNAMQTFIEQKATVQATLEAQGLSQIKVYPDTENCYRWNAVEGTYRIKTGKVCMGETE